MYENPINYLDFSDPESIIRETLNYEENSVCHPTVIDTVTTLDNKGKYVEQDIYNCASCSNIECPYFYEEQ